MNAKQPLRPYFRYDAILDIVLSSLPYVCMTHLGEPVEPDVSHTLKRYSVVNACGVLGHRMAQHCRYLNDIFDGLPKI